MDKRQQHIDIDIDIVSTESLLNFQSADDRGTDLYERLEEKFNGTSQPEGCNPHCSCATKKLPGKVMVQHDLSSHETPCVCSRLVDPSDSLTGWDSPPADNCGCKQANGNKNKKPLPYSKLYQKEQPDDFVFQHYRDSKRYIEQYRLYHTKGTIRQETDATPVLGHDAPDPYLPKLRSIRGINAADAKTLVDKRARLHNDSFMDSRSKSFNGFEKRNAFQPMVYNDDRRRQAVNLSGHSHLTSQDTRSNGSNSASSGGSDGQPRPNTTSRCTEEINLAPTREKLAGEKKQYSEVQSSYMDLQTPRASFPLPVRIVEDYCGASGSKARATSPKPFKSSHQHQPAASSLSPRTSYSNSHLQETIALMQKFPENQTNVSNMILSAISDPAVYQHYLAKLKKVDHSQSGAFLVGSTVSRTEKPKRTTAHPPSLPHPHKDKNLQVGLCELYSSGSGLYTGPVALHQNAIERERPREVPTSPLSKLDVRGCQYRGSATRKSLNGRPRRPVPSGSVRRTGSTDNE
ncbi:uncharacterized protein LOC135483722 isoform X2 [Lineus longissimus]|uniref:uncharacterized protein LOC135483722 isoform X2 n=1 Tax=Lineus longissimus TaxID=88925 RepID=UPI002B4EF357